MKLLSKLFTQIPSISIMSLLKYIINSLFGLTYLKCAMNATMCVNKQDLNDILIAQVVVSMNLNGLIGGFSPVEGVSGSNMKIRNSYI